MHTHEQHISFTALSIDVVCLSNLAAKLRMSLELRSVNVHMRTFCINRCVCVCMAQWARRKSIMWLLRAFVGARSRLLGHNSKIHQFRPQMECAAGHKHNLCWIFFGQTKLTAFNFMTGIWAFLYKLTTKHYIIWLCRGSLVQMLHFILASCFIKFSRSFWWTYFLLLLSILACDNSNVTYNFYKINVNDATCTKNRWLRVILSNHWQMFNKSNELLLIFYFQHA